eukprot:9662_1
MAHNQNKELSFLWTAQFISTKSLHSNQSSFSSVINTIETALRLDLDEEPSVALTNNVYEFASSYHSSKPTEVSEILTKMTRYNASFTFLDSIQCNVEQINKSVAKMFYLLVNTQSSVNCIITSVNNPNMIVLLHKSYKSEKYIFYQSQPQNDTLNGAHFLIFTDSELLNVY